MLGQDFVPLLLTYKALSTTYIAKQMPCDGA